MDRLGCFLVAESCEAAAAASEENDSMARRGARSAEFVLRRSCPHLSLLEPGRYQGYSKSDVVRTLPFLSTPWWHDAWQWWVIAGLWGKFVGFFEFLNIIQGGKPPTHHKNQLARTFNEDDDDARTTTTAKTTNYHEATYPS